MVGETTTEVPVCCDVVVKYCIEERNGKKGKNKGEQKGVCVVL